MEKRRIFSSFPKYFQYISDFNSPVTHIFVKCGCSSYFFPQFCKSDMSRYGYLEVFQRVLGIRDNENRLYSFVKCACSIIFPQFSLHIKYVEVRISRSISEHFP